MIRASASSIVLKNVYEGLDAKQANGQALFSPNAVPMCHLLDIDGSVFLLDCGWSADCNERYLARLVEVLPSVDCVLLSSSEFQSCGALPVAVKFLRPDVPILMTIAASRLAMLTVVSQLVARFAEKAEFQLRLNDRTHFVSISSDDVSFAFNRVRDGPYGAVATVQPSEERRGVEVTVRSFRAGRLLGACGWRLTYQTDDIVYIPNFAAENTAYLPGLDVQVGVGVLITDCYPNSVELKSEAETSVGRRMIRQIREVLRQEGVVLIPVAACSRGIETLLTLNALFQSEGFVYPLVLCALKAKELIDRIRTLTEFLREGVYSEEKGLLNNVVLATSAAEAMEIQGPKCIVADGWTLEDGPSGEILLALTQELKKAKQMRGQAPMMAGHAVIFVEQPPLDTVAGRLWAKSEEGSSAVQQHPQRYGALANFTSVKGNVFVRRALTGEALERHYDEQERKQQAAAEREEAELKEAEAAAKNAPDQGDDEDDDLLNLEEEEGDAEGEGAATGTGTGKKGRKAMLQVKLSAQGSGSSSLLVNRLARHCDMYFPSHIEVTKSKFPLFPIDPSTTNVGLDLTPYGVPMKPWELRQMRKVVPMRHYSDLGPEAQPALGDEGAAQEEVPTDVVAEPIEFPAGLEGLAVRYYNCAGYVDGESLRQLLQAYYRDVRKLVLTRGCKADAEALMSYAKKEFGMFLPTGEQHAPTNVAAHQNQFCFSLSRDDASGQSLQLATEIHCYSVRLDKGLALQAEANLRRVRNAEWQIGWIHGMVDHPTVTSRQAEESTAVGRKRGRDDTTINVEELPHLLPLKTEGQREEHQQEGLQASNVEETALDEGSVFVGAVDYPTLRNRLQAHNVSRHPKAPMYLIDGSSYVRCSTSREVTIESVASPFLFEVRQQVYDCFSQIL